MGKTLLLVMLLSIPGWAQSPFHARVGVIVGDLDRRGSPLENNVRLLISHQLEGIDGVITVQKYPDYIISVVIGSQNDKIALGMQAVEIPETRIAEALLRGAKKDQIKTVGAVLASLGRAAGVDIEIGTAADLPTMCARIVRVVDNGAFQDERQFPRGSDDVEALTKNFFARMGGREVK